MRFLLELAWRDLRHGGAPLWVFAACIALGVALVTAGGGLHRQVAASLEREVRAMFGADVEVRSARPLSPELVAWLEERGTVSQLVRMRTMLRTAGGRSQLVELFGVDDRYPLYGELRLDPPTALPEALARRDGAFGLVPDAVLAQRLGVRVGDNVEIGDALVTVHALLEYQPDRSLRAEWYGAPVLLASAALAETGLIQPGSRIDYQVRLRTSERPARVRAALASAFPAAEVQVRTVDGRTDRVAEILGGIASGLLLVGLSALFIGGLGVANSVRAWLDGRLATFATLRALGMRDAKLVAMVFVQVITLALAASMAGAAAGVLLARAGLGVVAERLPVLAQAGTWIGPAIVGIGFGVLVAIAFSIPALGRAVSVTPAALFRGVDGQVLATPRLAWLLAGALGAAIAALILLLLPDRRFAIAFFAVAAALLLLLEGVLRLLRVLASRALAHPRWHAGFELRVALSGLQRPGSPLRASLVSLGSALVLLVACAVVVAALLRTVNEVVPARAPSLVFYDVQADQLALLDGVLREAPSLEQVQTAPLVIGRVAQVNGEVLGSSADPLRRREAQREHKLSYRHGNIDDVMVIRGAWWPDDYRGPPLVAMEDREADALGLAIGDDVVLDIVGRPVGARLAAIYAQRRFQSRLWLEAIVSDGALDGMVTRYVGAAYLGTDDALRVQDRLAAVAPSVVTVRTQAMLDAVRSMMRQAGAGLAVLGGACLAASLLVLASVVAAHRSRQVFEAGVMHTLGARMRSLRRVLHWEHVLLASVTAGFAMVVGTALAMALLEYRLELDATGLAWIGALVAVMVSFTSLGVGAQVMLAQLSTAPARLLRRGQ